MLICKLDIPFLEHTSRNLRSCTRWNHLLFCSSQESQRRLCDLWLHWGCAMGWLYHQPQRWVADSCSAWRKGELLNNTNSWGANYVFSIPGKISAKHPLQSLCRQMKPVLCGGLPPPPRGSGVLAPNFLSQTGRWRNNVLNLSVHSLVCYQTCEQDILKTKKPILMPIGTNGSQGLRMV